MICPAGHSYYLDANGRMVVAYDSDDFRALVLNQDSGRLIDASPPLVSLNPGETGGNWGTQLR